MADKAPSAWSLVLVPAVVSLLITILRLVGELQGWDPSLFSNVAPGPDSKQGLFGISWLIPIFGFWFGFKLRRATGEPANIGKSALRYLIGAAVLIGGFFALMKAGLIVMPSAEAPGEPSGLGYGLALMVIAAVILFTAWPRLGRTLVLYALLARIPVIVVTYLALQFDWDSHYTKLPEGAVLPEGTSKFLVLATPQLTIWIVATMLIGGLCGCLGALLGRKR